MSLLSASFQCPKLTLGFVSHRGNRIEHSEFDVPMPKLYFGFCEDQRRDLPDCGNDILMPQDLGVARIAPSGVPNDVNRFNAEMKDFGVVSLHATREAQMHCRGFNAEMKISAL